MHRVLTFQLFQHDNEASEAINKRLCCSFLLTTAFLSIIGGFLLGRYTTEKAILLNKSRLCGPQEEKKIDSTLNNLSIAIKTFSVLTSASEVKDSPEKSIFISNLTDQLYNILQCKNYSITLPNLNIFKTDVHQFSNVILNYQIESLVNCVNNATLYVQQNIREINLNNT